MECLKGAVARLEAESIKMSEEVPLHGGGVVAAPTMSDGLILCCLWNPNPATLDLTIVMIELKP